MFPAKSRLLSRIVTLLPLFLLAPHATKAAPIVPAAPQLMLWVRADDLKGLKEGERVGRWPDASGQGRLLTSTGDARPTYHGEAVYGRPGVVFEKLPDPRTQSLFIPIGGEWSGATIFVVGKQLSSPGWLETNPSHGGSLRVLGWVQLSGTAAAVNYAFGTLAGGTQPEVAALRAGVDDEGAMHLSMFANGKEIGTAGDPDPKFGINWTAGKARFGSKYFGGAIAEVLIYRGTLNEAQMAEVQRYLAGKYGIAPAADSPAQPLGFPLPISEKPAPGPWSATLPVLPHTQSWLANTFSGSNDEGWVQHGMNGVTSLPDGTVAAISVWDEKHKEIGLYKDGKAAGGTRTGGAAIANDGTYLYCALSGYGKLFAGVRRLTLDGKDAPWAGAPPVDIGGRRPPQGAIRFDVPAPWTEVNSIALSKDELYLTVQGFDEVRVYDLAQGTFRRTFALKAPRKLAVDKAGKLWAVSEAGLAQYNPDGTPTGARIAGVKAGALATDGKGLLWVADVGERQQLIGYDVSGTVPREVRTVGTKGGIFGGPRPGQLTDDRIPPAVALSIDPKGNFAVLGSVLRGYSPEGALLYTLQCTSFTMCWDFDPASDGIVIYSGNERYDYVPGAAPGKDWKLAAFTSDVARFPDLPAGGGQTMMRRLNGQLLRYTLGGDVFIHRQEANSDIFAPAGIVIRPDQSRSFRPAVAPKEGRYVWNDVNGNGLIEAPEISLPKAGAPPSQYSYSCWIDSEGTIWEPQDREGVRCLPVKGFSAQGAPLYDLTNEVWYPKPREFLQVMRAIYLARTDTMLLTGTTWDHSALGTEWWGGCGREVICYADWKKPSRKILWRTAFPEAAATIKAVTVAPAASLFFAGQMDTMTVFAYDLRDGKLVGIVEPDRKLFGDVGWIDIDSGIRAFTRQNGEVLLLSEEIYGQKQIVYRLQPTNARAKK